MEKQNHPYDRFVQALRARGALNGAGCREGPRKSRARCPVHADRRASLCVTYEIDKVLLCCHAGCASAKVVHELGFRWTDTFLRTSGEAPRHVLVATYDYCDQAGVVIARKLRFQPKRFVWQTPDPRNGN